MDGILNINKPAGMTSHDVVDYIRRITNIEKVGHTGTLDPDATGVLPVCIGRATKIVQFLINENKSYRVTLLLGVSTSTQDISGNVVKEVKNFNITQKDIEDILISFTGDIEQIPPMVSALRINGKRLYKLARQGKEVEREARKITIYKIGLLEVKLPYVSLEIDCSKGTYVRTLCSDIGDRLGMGACLYDLVRTRSGRFDLNNAVGLKDIKDIETLKNNLKQMNEVLDHLPMIRALSGGIKLLRLGKPLTENNISFFPGISGTQNLYRLYQDKSPELLGIVEKVSKEGKIFKIVKWL
ncbi:MAG: tRNA pseudouridine(55) synthase TruB [bacterium]|nr:tRNA pseudouridine(55) synthase TruB [bacterium]